MMAGFYANEEEKTREWEEEHCFRFFPLVADIQGEEILLEAFHG
jgi:hypothetical protein